MNLPCSFCFNLGTPRIILLRSPALRSEQAIVKNRNGHYSKESTYEIHSKKLGSYWNPPKYSLIKKKFFFSQINCWIIQNNSRTILICIHTWVRTYIYIYIYIERERVGPTWNNLLKISNDTFLKSKILNKN